MNYYLYRLKFKTPVHFGTFDSALSLYFSEDHFLADTLFSALCHQALKTYGEGMVDNVITLAKEGKLFLSDSMIWKNEDYYIPKPFLLKEKSEENAEGVDRKAIKKIHWIPIDRINNYVSHVQGNETFAIDDISTSFGYTDESTKVRMGIGESLPYQVGIYKFDLDCGLYFIVGIEDEKFSSTFRKLLEGTGLDGIGGKTSAGYGKFEIDDEIYLNEPFDTQTEWIYKSLENDANCYLLITTAMAKDDELDNSMIGASYQLTRRSGFVNSQTYSKDFNKKKTEFYFSAGSIFSSKFSGDIKVVADKGSHNVYRYSRPLFFGVNI